MGREIRKVPPNWDHPKDANYPDRLKPMYDKTYESARRTWLDGLAAWEAGKDKDRETFRHDDGTPYEYWEWNGNPPDRDSYRPWRDEDATWFQLWETVSEGTPVSPPFATKQELADHLAEHGDFWDHAGWGKKRAEAFVMGDGWAPTMVVSDGVVMTGVEFVTKEK